jgi:hypothetical protein
MLAHPDVNFSTFPAQFAQAWRQGVLTGGYSPFMRIELPSPSWAEVHHAQDDAHTLTLPQQRPVSLAQPQLLADRQRGETLHVRVAPAEPGELTLTL